MARATQAIVDLSAFCENYLKAKRCAPNSRVYAVMKANAYGHGLLPCANALRSIADGYAVACVEEAQKLRVNGVSSPILVLEGPMDASECVVAIQLDLELAIHHQAQLDWLKGLPGSKKLWLKVDTGMHRLGFSVKDALSVVSELGRSAFVGLMSHFACADQPEHLFNKHQISQMSELAHLGLPISMGNSAAILEQPKSHFNIIRPGIMLYGCSPLMDRNAVDLGLKSVMTLQSNVISLHDIEKGESVGYGRSFVAQKNTKIAVVAIGYGDGYPRSAPPGTPVLIQGRRWPLVGRVSMDMITIDVSGGNIQLGDKVTLWGDGLSVDEIALQCGTISYELLCQVTSRVKMRYVSEDRSLFDKDTIYVKEVEALADV